MRNGAAVLHRSDWSLVWYMIMSHLEHNLLHILKRDPP